MQKSIYTKQHQRLCELLTEARNAADLTQVEVARRLGKPQSFVSKYEAGERGLDVIEFQAIAQAIGIDPATFLAELQRGQAPRKPRSEASRDD
jgi:transcriptional regulator with XRE-family HTH domain